MKHEKMADSVTVSVRAKALESIFDDCDRYDHDETGGRILGVFRRRTPDGPLHIDIRRVIDAGPKARRSNSSFFQDGDYQTQIFRQLETIHPEIEHLGNWHTHHVNGYPTLSGGDIGTYRRIVNHEKHNLDFFYALLVVAREPKRKDLERYQIRHYILFCEDQNVYEIAPSNVVITEEPVVWPVEHEAEASTEASCHREAVRARDNRIIAELFPDLRPYLSRRANTFYWKGPHELIDDSIAQVTIPEMTDESPSKSAYYQIIVKNAPALCSEVVAGLTERRFESATQAIRVLEKQLNRTLYQAVGQRGS